MPIRAQETLYRWEYDNEDNLLGMTQMPPPDFGTYTIPMSKALLFRTKSRKNNPEGRSILRNAYRSWYFKRRIQEIEGIGIERDLAGLPVMHGPEGLDLWNDDIEDNKQTRIALENMVKSIRRDEMEGVVLPAGYELELLSSGGTRQFDTNAIINRYDTRIAMTVLADFIFLGHSETGSWALSSDKTELFAMAIGAFLDMICETFNSQGIPPLIDINGEHFAGITEYPKMSHGDIADVDVTKVAAFIKDMTGIGILVPDDGLEDYIRQVGHLPEATAEENTQPAVSTVETNEEETKQVIRANEEDFIAGLIAAADFASDEEETQRIEIVRNGKLAFAFSIRPLGSEEYDKCRKKFTKYVRNKQLGIKMPEDTDRIKYQSAIIHKATIAEDREKLWDNKKVWQALESKGFQIMSGLDVIEYTLKAGEKDRIIDAIDTLSGYESNIEEVAKN